MSQYKFDGTHLTERGSRVGRIDGNNIYDSRGAKAGRIDKDYIYDSRGSRIGRVDGRNVYDGRGSRIGTIDDVRKVIDGPGGTTIVALWILLVR